MRIFQIAALAALSLAAATGPAHAKRGAVPVFVSESLVHVADTAITGTDGAPMALCILAERETMVVLPTSFVAKAYVMSETGCTGDAYVQFSPFGFERAKAAGLIPADVPDTPQFSALQWASGAWGLILVGLLILGAIAVAARNAILPKRGKRAPSALTVRTLEALVHAAKADGHLSREEIRTIAAIVKRMTGQDMATSVIKELYADAAPTLTPDEFGRFAQDVPFDQRHIVMEAVAILLISDGDVPEAEQEFLAGLAYGLDLPPVEVERIIKTYLPQEPEPDYGGGAPVPA